MLRLPPLNAVRAFEAAARHGSITRAAEELRIAHSAVSRQVRALEAFLGTRLFARAGRGVALTPEGQRFHRACSRALNDLSEATGAFFDAGNGLAEVTVSVAPAFAIRWLMPRLAEFRAANPRIEVRISATERLADLTLPEAELAIRHGSGRWPDLVCRLLIADRLIAVSRPELPSGAPPAADLDRLLGHRHCFDVRDTPWGDWYGAQGRPDLARAIRLAPCDEANLVIAFAMAGQGIALARASLVEAELASGELVSLSPAWVPTRFPSYLVWHPARRLRGAARIFAEWVMRHRQAGAAAPNPCAPMRRDGGFILPESRLAQNLKR
jgi:LysR family glycine cleavage system transcriptional activator